MESSAGPLQPYDGIVHNGTIANDAELADVEGVPRPPIDSMILPRIINRDSLRAFRDSLLRLRGSFAIAAISSSTIYLGCNYKPLHVVECDGTIWFSSMARHLEPLCSAYTSPRQVPPYSVLDLRLGEFLPIPRSSNKRAVVVASSGLDSTVAACKLIADGYSVHLLHFQYGCRAQSRELDRINRIAEALSCRWSVLTLPYSEFAAGCGPLLGSDRLVNGQAGAEYGIEWVPARNIVMLATAMAFAEAGDFHTIAYGGNLEEGGVHPDNEEQMVIHLDQAANYAVQNGYDLRIVAPVGRLMKHEIVKLGLELGAPLQHTWSCYNSDATPCGECSSCTLRRIAFERNSTHDPAT